MRRLGLAGLTSVLLLMSSSCAAPKASEPAPEYRVTGTIKDLMDSLVDPNADYLWDSVSIISNAQGVTQKAPKTDEDWANERHHAIALLEATNLLQMPGRHVARPGEKAEDPKIEGQPEAIEALIVADRATWIKFAHGLYDATSVMMKSIDAKDATGVMNSSEGVDKACETCHEHYWYPHQYDNIQKSDQAAPATGPVTKTP